MAVGDDTLYLENLEEFVNDEDKIVTYKWLSRTLSVSANKAKQMLYAFVKAQQEERPDISHSITYVVGGRLDIDGNLVHKYVIVTDQDLEDTKKQFSPVTCVHIYSVQKCKPKDSNCLYTVDYEIIQQHKKDQNRWSNIQCKEAQCLSDRGVNRGGNRSSSSTANASSTSKMVNGTSERPGTSSKGGSNSAVDKKQKPSNEKTRKGQMSALEMFAKKPSTSSEKGEKEENAVKTEGSSVAAKKTAANSKPGSMKSFFGKAVAGSSATGTSEEKKENKKITPTKVENKDEKRVDRPKKNSKLPKEKEEDEEEPVPKKISKRMNRECDTEEEPIKLKKSEKKQKDESQSEVNKRKTKKKRAFILDSDEEPVEEMPAKKEHPKEKKSKKKRKRTKDLSEEENSHEEASSNSSGHSNENKTNDDKKSESSLANQQERSNESTRRRKRRKVLRSKTSMNEEGYMVTEKVWESESTDASDEEQAKEVATTAQSKGQARAPARQKPSHHSASTKLLPSDAKTNKPGKQASLMSFFQKS